MMPSALWVIRIAGDYCNKWIVNIIIKSSRFSGEELTAYRRSTFGSREAGISPLCCHSLCCHSEIPVLRHQNRKVRL